MLGWVLWVSLTWAAPQDARQELRVLTYDSLAAPGGWGEVVFPAFEKTCACRLKITTAGDGAKILARLELDRMRGKPETDIVIGIDQNLWPQAQAFVEPWGAWRPEGFDRIPAGIKVGDGFLPYDQGVFAFMWDSANAKELGLAPPKRFRDIMRTELKRRLILQDPRTSTPGLAFVLYTRELEKIGDGFTNLWNALRGQWLTLAPGWDAAYGMFLKGEAPLVWSYVTSQAYHRENGDPSRYQALVFDEGNPAHIEGAAIVRGSSAPRALSRAFLAHLISREAQAEIPKRQWMMPARSDASLPASFAALPKPVKLLGLRPVAPVKEVLQQWESAVRK